MGAILRIRTEDNIGALGATIFPIDRIVSMEISIRKHDTDSIESAINIEGQENPINYPEFNENKLTITKEDSTEASFDLNNYRACEFEIHDEDGVVMVKTDSLITLEKAYLASYIKDSVKRNQALKNL